MLAFRVIAAHVASLVEGWEVLGWPVHGSGGGPGRGGPRGREAGLACRGERRMLRANAKSQGCESKKRFIFPDGTPDVKSQTEGRRV